MNELIEYAKSMPKETETRQKVNKLVEKAESGKKVTNADVGELAVTMFEEGTIDAESYNWLLGISETKTSDQVNTEEASPKQTAAKETVNNAGESETEGKKLRYSDVLEEVRRNGASSVESIYSGVLSKLSDTKVLKKLLSMSKAERAFAKAGASGYDITAAVNMAKDAAIKGSGEVEALEYGLSLRGKGYGEEVEVLADIIEYGEANPDSEVNTLLSEFVEETTVDKTSRSAIMKTREYIKTNVKKEIPYSKSRPAYAIGQEESVWNRSIGTNGKVYDPSGEEMSWNRTKPRNGQWDMGHIPGQKYSDMHALFAMGALSRREFLDWYRNPANYRPELPKTNRSHKYE